MPIRGSSIVFFAVGEGRRDGVFGGDKRFEADLNGPVDGEIGVVPTQGAFHVGSVGCGNFVVEVGDVADHEEAMGAAGRHPEAVVRFGIEHISIPHTKGRRAFAEIDQHIKNGAGGDPYELALRCVAGLVVQPAEDMLGGAAVIVLDEVEIQPRIGEGLAVPCLHKETTGVAEDFGF